MQHAHLAPQPRRVRPLGGVAQVDATPSIHIDPAAVPEPQGYTLTLTPSAITIAAHDDAGAFYAQQTLAQLRTDHHAGVTIDAAVIEDWPDFPVRGLMVDVSRDRVPTMDGLYRLVDQLASLKVNQLQLYTEHTFAYTGHETVWKDASPLTGDEVRALDAYCAERFIELVPNQNCFGHLQRWLVHEPYRGFAECPDGFTRDDLAEPFFYPHPTTLNPLDPRSLELVRDMLAQLLPCFRSDTVNIGFDETFDLGKGRSKSACAERGKGAVYAEFLRQVHGIVEGMGKRAQFWGDIVLHYPEVLPSLPKDLVALNWGYETLHPFHKECRLLAESGMDFMVCPSTATFVGIGGRADVMSANIRSAAAHGLANGAAGLLNTWWGDFGHWQPRATNDPGIVYGAACAWCLSTNAGLDLAAALSMHVYGDATGKLARGVLELGRLTRDLPTSRDNVLGWSLIRDEAEVVGDALKLPWAKVGPLTDGSLEAAEQRVDGALTLIAEAQPTCADGALHQHELAVGGAMLKHASANLRARLRHQAGPTAALPLDIRRQLGEDARHIVAGFERGWQQRSRPGGLHDALGSWRRLIASYER